jgi:hypothetical protein
MAQLLMALTPDDRSDEQKLLKRVRKLLDEPKNETEEFRLARATYLLAVTSRPPKADLLREARDIFRRLEQTKWVEQCDELLKNSGELKPVTQKPVISNMGFGEMWQTTVKGWQGLRGMFYDTKPAATTPAAPENVGNFNPPPQQEEEKEQELEEAPATQPQPTVANIPAADHSFQPPPAEPPAPPTAAPVQAPAPAMPAFVPFGQWQLRVNDASGSIVYVNFVPNGVCFGSQLSPGVGHIQFSGRWAYSPQNRLLQLQGLINGMQPFMLNILIHGAGGEGFYGVGSDNYAYFLAPYKAQ